MKVFALVVLLLCSAVALVAVEQPCVFPDPWVGLRLEAYSAASVAVETTDGSHCLLGRSWAMRILAAATNSYSYVVKVKENNAHAAAGVCKGEITIPSGQLEKLVKLKGVTVRGLVLPPRPLPPPHP